MWYTQLPVSCRKGTSERIAAGTAAAVFTCATDPMMAVSFLQNPLYASLCACLFSSSRSSLCAMPLLLYEIFACTDSYPVAPIAHLECNLPNDNLHPPFTLPTSKSKHSIPQTPSRTLLYDKIDQERRLHRRKNWKNLDGMMKTRAGKFESKENQVGRAMMGKQRRWKREAFGYGGRKKQSFHTTWSR